MIGFDVKKAFFDQSKVVRLMDRKARQSLIRVGSFVRRTAQQSMRSSKKSARPGEPPKAHKNPLLKKMLFFAYDQRNKSVVVGPVKLERTKEQGVPKLLEKGGMGQRMQGGLMERMHYRGNPFMKPALDKNFNVIAESLKM